MKYQLVLQFSTKLIADYDEMVAVENELIEKLNEFAKVDGHDFGSGEMNVFIHTDEPAKVFEMIKTSMVKRKLIDNLTAAYRKMDGEDYMVIWPTGFTKQFRIT